MPATAPTTLELIEACYDAIPRVAATVEEVGPFTLFRPDADTAWDFYARPRLGGSAAFTADDVRRVLARQRELGVARAIEWVHEVTPSLLPAVQESLPAEVLEHGLEECPLLALDAEPAGPAEAEIRILGADDADLPWAVGVVGAAFDGTDEAQAQDPARRRALITSGDLVVAAAYVDGQVVGAGSAAPRGTAAELMGIGVLPRARTQGLGAAITAALAREVRGRGVATCYLSAASDGAASVYRGVGFTRIGTAYILDGGA